jgi:hypothetical protein
MFKKFRKKMNEDAGEIRHEAVRHWCETLPGVTLIANARPREIVRVAGIVETLRVRPREGVPAIEAIITDGTGTVTAVWLGRRNLPGLTLNARLILEGRLGGERPRLQVMNPQYEFVAAPGAH